MHPFPSTSDRQPPPSSVPLALVGRPNSAPAPPRLVPHPSIRQRDRLSPDQSTPVICLLRALRCCERRRTAPRCCERVERNWQDAASPPGCLVCDCVRDSSATIVHTTRRGGFPASEAGGWTGRVSRVVGSEMLATAFGREIEARLSKSGIERLTERQSARFARWPLLASCSLLLPPLFVQLATRLRSSHYYTMTTTFLWEQTFGRMKPATTPLNGRVVCVTGANTGLGVSSITTL